MKWGTWLGALLVTAANSGTGFGADLGLPPRQTGGGERSGPVLTSDTSLTVDTADRAAVVRLYQSVYRASAGVDMGWTGDVPTCQPGTNTSAYQDATLLRINYYRAMAGLPGNIVLDASLNAKCQAAALMLVAQGQVSHQPDASWKCYSAGGAEAAGHANLYLGAAGPQAIDGYIDDIGAANYFVGHRRWILHPPQRVMGTGSLPRTDTSFWPANALWVIGDAGARPAQPEWVAWPPQGYVPYAILPSDSGRWSFSYPKANFKAATVAMTCRGTNVPVTLEPQANDIGYADNTLVWIPQGVPTGPPAADLTYSVALANVLVNGQARVLTYPVTIIDPEPVSLAIQPGAKGTVELSWPSNTSTFRLWGRDAMGFPGSWQMIYPLPTFENGTNRVSYRVQGQKKFFRLQRE